MAAPIVQWYNEDNDTQQTSWSVGTVDAGSESDETTFLIWNNRGGQDAVSDMTNCSITTKDSEGGNDAELVTEKWIQVKDELNDQDFTAVGGDDSHPIGGSVGSTDISGKANDGTVSGTGEGNFAKVVLKAVVPPVATAGAFQFLTRVSYQYV